MNINNLCALIYIDNGPKGSGGATRPPEQTKLWLFNDLAKLMEFYGTLSPLSPSKQSGRSGAHYRIIFPKNNLSHSVHDVLEIMFDINPPGHFENIIRAANQIKHCGDYCRVFYRINDNHVYIVLGDGDMDPSRGFTTYDEIVNLFKAEGIQHITIEAEIGPDEEGWIFIPEAIGKAVIDE
jgi:hypothetical protein